MAIDMRMNTVAAQPVDPRTHTLSSRFDLCPTIILTISPVKVYADLV